MHRECPISARHFTEKCPMVSRNTQNKPVLEPDAINTLREMSVGQNENFINTFIDLYLRSSGECMELIIDFSETGDSGALRSAAHKLRGASLNIGGLQVAEICGGLEKKAKKQDLADVEEIVNSLDNAYQVLRDALAEVRGD